MSVFLYRLLADIMFDINKISIPKVKGGNVDFSYTKFAVHTFNGANS